MEIIVMAAANLKNVIGLNGKLPEWRLPLDLKRFKNKTLDSIIIMGRKTYESLPGLLPRRKHVVISGTLNKDQHPEIEIVSNFYEAIMYAENMKAEKVFIVGGERVFKDGLEIADAILLTRVLSDRHAGDVFLPEINMDEWIVKNNEGHFREPGHSDDFVFMDLERKK